MQIAKDCFAVIEYEVRLADGSIIKGENGPVSMNFVAGYAQIMPALEKKLLGLPEGTATEFTIPAPDAFGEYDEGLVHTRTFAEFPAGRELQPGKWALATNEQTQVQFAYFVKDKTESTVTIDYNHPLAGKDLHYRVKVVNVRPALQEELEYLRPCQHGKDTAAAE